MGLGFRERDLVQKRVGLGLDSGILESIRESPRATGGPLKSTKSVGFELAVPLPESATVALGLYGFGVYALQLFRERTLVGSLF